MNSIGSNIRMNRSARTTVLMEASVRRAPGYAWRYTWSEISDEEFRRAKPRPHSLEQSIYETTAVIRCAGSAVALKRRRG